MSFWETFVAIGAIYGKLDHIGISKYKLAAKTQFLENKIIFT